MSMLTNALNWQELALVYGHILINKDGLFGLGVKGIIVIFGFVILIYGAFLGPKGKPRDTKNYDAKEKNQIKHHLRAAEGGNDYVYKGSGKYRNSRGEVKKDK